MSNEHLAPVATMWPHPSIREYWDSGKHATEGGTQPWVAALLYGLVRAMDIRHVAELGCYLGATSAWLALAIEANGGGSLTLVDTQADWLQQAAARVMALDLQKTALGTMNERSLDFLAHMNPDTRLVFLDDDKAEIPAKLDALRALKLKEALVAIHDMETINVPGALVLATPVLHGTGLLGLVQV